MKSVKELFRVIQKLNEILTKKQKRGSIWVLCTMIICSFLELLGVSILMPFLELMTNTESLRDKWYISWIYDIYPEADTTTLMMAMCVLFMLIYILKNLFMIYSSYVQNVYSANFNKEDSTKMLDSYLKRPYEYFTNTNSGELIRSINGDVYGVYTIILDLFTIISELITIALIGIFLLMTDWFIALTALALASICMLVTVLCFKKKLKEAGQIGLYYGSIRSQASIQAISGIKEITVLNRRPQFVRTFEKSAEGEKKTIITRGVLAACPDRILEGICMSGFMLIVCIRVSMGGDFTAFVPVLGTFAMGAFKVLPSFAKLSSRIGSIVSNTPFLDKCYENFKEANIIDDNYRLRVEDNKKNSITDICFNNSLSVSDINWKYKNSKENVLEGLSIIINKGESVAFIGPSGAGKTTLADIIMGLYIPQQGTVEMDGIDIYSIREDWSRIIGYVPQSVYLIDDTIRKNVAFGLDDEDIDDDKVWSALARAQIKEYVEQLPDGLDTIVGERGVKFSGGQRQRVAIARALYEDPDILVLDEATSALDNDTEAAVMEAIDSLQGTKTLIIVAHRLSTIKNCDKIYEINNKQAKLVDKKDIL